ncbi:MAG: hypothetical protein HQ568_12505 [Calditrichaeota bacterium]|nr:hypothetical protein [Calditrichota bacterium]
MKRTLLFTILLSAVITFKPAIADSALSSLGYGLPQSVANARAAGMGLVSLAMPDTLRINLLSPASWDGPATTRFGFGVDMIHTRLEDKYATDENDISRLNGLALGIPVGKDRFIGFGISPYTRMEYEWTTIGSNALIPSEVTEWGRGGISQSIIAFSTPFKQEFRLGISVRPIFGQIDRRWLENPSDETYKSSGIQVVDRLSGVGWGLSCQWNRLDGWAAGMVVQSPIGVGVKRQIRILVDNVVQYDDKTRISDGYDLPWDVSFGVSRAFLSNHRTGFEFAWQGWSGLENAIVPTNDLADAMRLGLGWEWSPNYMPFDPLWKALTYRGGFYMQDHYALGINGNQSRKVALTGGISVPYFDLKSRIDIALEIGWMGDRSKDEIAERTISISIGFNHSQKWFIGRREKN